MFQFFLNMFNVYSDGADYEPSSPKDTHTIVDLLKIQAGDRAADLGSGDGRIVIALALKGAISTGFEINTELVERAKKNIRRKKLENAATIKQANFWTENLSQYNKVVVFQYHTIMDRLERKLMKELRIGSFVVSHHWRFPRWQPVSKERDIYLYIKE